jgi:hypothetical protein
VVALQFTKESQKLGKESKKGFDLFHQWAQEARQGTESLKQAVEGSLAPVLALISYIHHSSSARINGIGILTYHILLSVGRLITHEHLAFGCT